MPLRPIAGVLLLLCTAVVSACASLTSQTSIPPGQAFRLGGDQPGAFVVRGTNTGAVPIVIISERAGTRDSVATLAPGAPVDARFPARATAIFMNRSATETAVVAIKVTGDVGNLGMTYETPPKR